MRPYPFEYAVAESVDHATTLLAEHGDRAKLIAGGQSLVPMMNLHLARPAILISVNRLSELSYVDVGRDQIRIGATTREIDIELSGALKEACPLLADATRHIGHPAIRNRGTIGGSLAHNDPAAEYPATLLALDASITLRGPGGIREVSIAELVGGRILDTSMAADEMIESISIPRRGRGTGHGFGEESRRKGDFAVVGIAASITIGERGEISHAALGAFGGSQPARLASAEEIMLGEKPGPELLAEVAAEVGASFPSTADVYASAQTRTRLAKVLSSRVIGEAVARAQQNL